MNWLGLTPLEFVAVFGMAAGAAVWLYLLHQRPRRKLVSTLRFWKSLDPEVSARRRRRLQEPWALLAQLLFLLLVILALANLRWGSGGAGRFVVLVVDASVWAQTTPPSGENWMESARKSAGQVLSRLRAGDEVLLMRADAENAPVLPFTSDLAAVRRALREMQPSDTVADVSRALEYADQALAGKRRTTIVYVGPGMLDDAQSHRLDALRRSIERREPGDRPQLLVRLVGDSAVDNRGITRLALRRDPAEPSRWHLLTQIRNYSHEPADLTLRLSAAGRPLQQQRLRVAAGDAIVARDQFTWAGGGALEAEIEPADALTADNRAVTWLPSFRPARVAVYSSSPALLQQALASNPYLRTEFLAPGKNPVNAPDATIYDASRPPDTIGNAIVFMGGAGGSEARITAWNPQHPVSRWIRTRDVSVRASAGLTERPGDTVLASGGGRPLVLAREEAGRKTVLVGFDPRQSNLPLQPAFPLLLAAAIEWMAGAVEDVKDSHTAGEVRLPGEARKVAGGDGKELPFARAGEESHLIAVRAGVYRVSSSEGDSRIGVNVPPLPVQRWKPTEAEQGGLRSAGIVGGGRELWRWLVMLALLPLWLEWWLFYRRAKATPLRPQPATVLEVGQGGTR